MKKEYQEPSLEPIVVPDIFTGLDGPSNNSGTETDLDIG